MFWHYFKLAIDVDMALLLDVLLSTFNFFSDQFILFESIQVVLVSVFIFVCLLLLIFSRSCKTSVVTRRHFVNGGGVLLVPIASTAAAADQEAISCTSSSHQRRSDFPADFKFGASTSAFQTEGSANVGGRGDATWDIMITMGKEFPELPESEDVATLSYYKYKEDVQLLKNMNVDVYRFSISWSRILPKGRGNINQDGINFYNNLINELIDNGIEPFVTLFHFDLPLALQTEYYGFLDRQIVDDFKYYCDICFKNYGDRVKRWVTFNEPSMFAEYGYKLQLHIPIDKSKYSYIVAHNLILAHAAAATLYKQKYQTTVDGEIGIALLSDWFEPYSESIEDKAAVGRAISFRVGWFVQPIVYGEYPFIMKCIVGERLPCFTDEEIKMVRGSCDFIGINYYTSKYVKSIPMNPTELPESYEKDTHYEMTVRRYDGKYIGERAEGNPDHYVVPEGLRELLIFMKLNYNDPKIYITENGTSEHRNDHLPLDKALDDPYRITFIQLHLNAIQQALRAGVKVKGYFIWSLIDCMEISGKADGNYSKRFGLNFVDYNNKLKRIPKLSAKWLSNFLKPTTCR